MNNVNKYFIEWIIFLTATTHMVPILAIKCYKCNVANVTIANADQLMYTIPSCANFNRSSNRFIIDCPYSTMCLKTISTMSLPHGAELKTVTRDCAQQKFETYVFKNRDWVSSHTIEEVYTEECMTIDGDNLAPSHQTLCHCRGDLCNLASSNLNSIAFILLLSILVIKLRQIF